MAAAAAGGAAGIGPATLLQFDPAGRAVMGDGTPTRDVVLQCLSLHNILQFRATCQRSRAVIGEYDCADVPLSIPHVTESRQLLALHKALPRVRGLHIQMKTAEYMDCVLVGGFPDPCLQLSSISQAAMAALGRSLRHFALSSSCSLGEYSFKCFGKLVSLSLEECEADAAMFGFITSLRHLKYCHTTSVPAEGLRSLAPRLLTLELNGLEAEVQLPVMPQLRRLTLSSITLADAPLPRLPLLAELYISEVGGVTDDTLWPMVAIEAAAQGQWVAQETLHTTLRFYNTTDTLAHPLSAAQLALCPSLLTLSMHGFPTRLQGQHAVEQWKQAVKNVQHFFGPFRAVDTCHEDGTRVQHSDLSLLQYVRCLKGVDLSGLPWATDAMVAQFRQLEYLDITRGTGITVDGLWQLRKLKVLRMGVELERAQGLVAQLVPYILSSPALLVMQLEVYRPGERGMSVLWYPIQSEDVVSVVNSLIAALRPRLAVMGPDGSPIRVTKQRLENVQAALGQPFSTWKTWDRVMSSSFDVCVAIHRAELASWSGPNLMDWHAEEGR